MMAPCVPRSAGVHAPPPRLLACAESSICTSFSFWLSPSILAELFGASGGLPTGTRANQRGLRGPRMALWCGGDVIPLLAWHYAQMSVNSHGGSWRAHLANEHSHRLDRHIWEGLSHAGGCQGPHANSALLARSPGPPALAVSEYSMHAMKASAMAAGAVPSWAVVGLRRQPRRHSSASSGPFSCRTWQLPCRSLQRKSHGRSR